MKMSNIISFIGGAVAATVAHKMSKNARVRELAAKGRQLGHCAGEAIRNLLHDTANNQTPQQEEPTTQDSSPSGLRFL